MILLPLLLTDINECEFIQCQANANCSDTIGSYECNCLPGYRADPAGTCSSKLNTWHWDTCMVVVLKKDFGPKRLHNNDMSAWYVCAADLPSNGLLAQCSAWETGCLGFRLLKSMLTTLGTCNNNQFRETMVKIHNIVCITF